MNIMTKPVSLYEQVLEISRQNQMGGLTSFFEAQFHESVKFGHYTGEDVLEQDRQKIIKWLEDYRTQTGAGVVVLGMSGGVDSSLVAALFKEAGWRVIGYALPIDQNPDETTRGVEMCQVLGIEHSVIDLTDTYFAVAKEIAKTDKMLGALHDPATPQHVNIRLGNIRARLRMVTLYNMASMHGGIVASTDNLSELQAGFWTLHGDVGDVAPIQGFNKSWEVPMLAKMSGVPESTWRATPTDGLGISNGDEAQLGCSYLEWDLMTQAMSMPLLLASNTPVTSDFMQGVLSRTTNFDSDPRAKVVFDAVRSRTSKTWFKRVNPINFEHPRLHTLSQTAKMDARCYQPTVVSGR